MMIRKTRPTRHAAVFALALGSLVALPPTLQAQLSGSDTTVTATPTMDAPVARSDLRVAGSTGGVLGSGAGIVGGALIGASLATCSSGEWLCGMGEAAVGAMLGSVIGSALGAETGVRLAGGRPSGQSWLGSLLGGAAGIGAAALVAAASPDGGGLATLLSFSLAQGVVAGVFAAR